MYESRNWRFGGTSLALTLLGLAAGCASTADQWTQWGGPNRDFHVASQDLADTWPEEGPPVIWERTIGDGFSTIVTDGKTLYTMSRKDADNEAILAIDAGTGETVWEHVYAAPYTNEGEDRKHTQEFGSGPNSTPLLVNGRLFAIGYTGKMHCLDARTGQEIWMVDLLDGMKGTFLQFGYAASPIAYRDKVIVLVGGQGQGVVAFDQATGDVAWKATDYDISFSSPILVKVGGQDHLVAYMGSHVIGLAPETGAEHWSFEHKNQYNTAIGTPIWCPPDRVYFVNGGDELGGRMVRLTNKGGKIAAEPVWQNRKISGGLSNPVVVGDCFYGPQGGRTDQLIAYRVSDGEIVARQRDFAKPKPIYADGKLIILDEKGQLMVARAIAPSGGAPTGDAEATDAEAAPNECVEILASAKLLEEPAWSAPTLVGSKLYLRDRGTIKAVELGAAAMR